VTQHVVTANAQFYVLAEERQDFRDCIRGADYVCADGVSIVVACKWLGRAKATRIPGVDLVSDLCRSAAGLALKVFFLGGNPGSAERSAAILTERFPGLRVAGISCPPKGFSVGSRNAQQCPLGNKGQSSCHSLRCAWGSVSGVLIQDHIRPMNIPVAVVIGGSLDIIAGEFKRAPRYIQRARPGMGFSPRAGAAAPGAPVYRRQHTFLFYPRALSPRIRGAYRARRLTFWISIYESTGTSQPQSFRTRPYITNLLEGQHGPHVQPTFTWAICWISFVAGGRLCWSVFLGTVHTCHGGVFQRHYASTMGFAEIQVAEGVCGHYWSRWYARR